MKFWKILGGSIGDWMKDVLCLQRMPSDPAERRRIKVFILGAGAGAAMPPRPDGKVHIEIEQQSKEAARKVKR